MTAIPIACIIFGCLGIPLIVTDTPLKSYSEYYLKPKQKIDQVKKSCYVNGVFYVECPS